MRTTARPRPIMTSIALIAMILAAPALIAGALQTVTLVKFKDTTSDAAISSMLKDSARIVSAQDGVIGYQAGMNNSPEGLDQGFTHAFVVTFDGMESRLALAENPAFVAHQESALPLFDKLFTFGFEVDEAARVPEVGRTRHLVFFRYKPDADPQAVAGSVEAFAALQTKISGLLSYEAGTLVGPSGPASDFTHAFLLTFINERARNDYLPHPAHKAFGGLLGPILAEPLVVDFTVTPSNRSLFVTSGLEPYRVYQRAADGTATVEFSGVCADSGTIEARLRAGRRTVRGFDWREVGEAAGGRFTAALRSVPTGGEYTVEVRRRDRLGNIAAHTEVADILVGDLWILAGQSNMEGVGNLADVEEPSPFVHCYTMGHRWELAREPLHWLIDSPDPVHSGRWLSGLDEAGRRTRRAEWRARRNKGAGLGLPFATDLVKRTGVPIGLVASAHGGTSMEQWNPDRRDEGGASLYGSMLKQVRNAGGIVKGVLWYQGESDANPGAVPHFAERMKKLVAAFRSDLRSPELPFYWVQIGRFVTEGGNPEAWNRIQDLQRTLAEQIPHTAVVASIDLPLDDLIHVGTDGLKRLGKRLSRIAHKNLYGGEDLETGPRFTGLELLDDGWTIRLAFAGVNERLTPRRKIEGFSLHGEDGAPKELIYRAMVDPASPTHVLLKLRAKVVGNVSLRYGAGLNPTCNLGDKDDIAAPVLGSIPVE